MARRRYLLAASATVGVMACSLVTSVPDLSSGAAGTDDASTCPPHVFTYDPAAKQPRTVHVAGSFNGWPKTIDGGGWPLAKTTSTQWTLTRVLPDGHNVYKLVIDESDWIADPANPNQTPDGFGKTNSVLDVHCER